MKIIMWAFDPVQNPEHSKNLVKEIRRWAKILNCRVQPVTVFSKTTTRFPEGAHFPPNSGMESLIKRTVDRFIKKTRTTDFLYPQILSVPYGSSRLMAVKLAAYALEKETQMLFVNTRAEKTWNPFRLGGFSETLATVAQIPVLMMNKMSRPSKNFSPILFPTNFDRDSKKALTVLEPWAKTLQSEVVLYNIFETPLAYPYDFNELTSSVDIETLTKDLRKNRERKAKAWAQAVEKGGVRCVPLVERERKYKGAQILDAAKARGAGIIALSSENANPLAKVLLGSVVRDILIKTSCPILIFHRSNEIQRSNMKESKRTSPKWPSSFVVEENKKPSLN